MTQQAIAEELLMRSRLRIKVHGEVFTPRRMVDQMLDLVSEDLESGPSFVDKTILEPAAGNGNFLVAILQRKLRAIESYFERDRWAVESLFALASIYGIELLEDNHADAQAAMLDVFLAFHTSHGIPCGPDTDLARAAAFIVDANILRGDTLTGLTLEGNRIEFSWWNRDSADHTAATRDPFTFNSLRTGAATPDLFATFDEPVRYAPRRIDHVHKEGKADR